MLALISVQPTYKHEPSSIVAAGLYEFKLAPGSVHPGITGKIENVYSSTPLTFRDYIGSHTGSLYGIKKDINKVIHTQINTKTSISNLFLTGQNISFHGILGTCIGAIVTCANFVSKEQLLQKIKNEKAG